MCTAFTLQSKDFYFGRNLDIEYNYNEEVCITPRNYPFLFQRVDPLKKHYALIGMAYVYDHYPLYYDATNEKGLSMAGLSMYNNTYYKEGKRCKYKLAPYEFIPFVLGQCACLEEAKKLLKEVELVALPFKDLPITPLHFMIADKSGCLVVECLQDGMKLFENKIGVCTNNPPFPLMEFCLQPYMHLSNKHRGNNFSEDIAFDIYSNGMGALGLPGDSTSISRFVRCSFYKYNSDFNNNEQKCVTQFFHILDSVKMIEGSVITKEGKKEKTFYSSCCNVDTGTYYYKTYDNMQISAVCLYKENLEETKLISYPLQNGFHIYYQNC